VNISSELLRDGWNGAVIAPTRSWNSSTSAESVRTFAKALGGSGETHIVPPAFVFSVAYPAPRVHVRQVALVSRIVELEVEWFRPLQMEERLQGQTSIADQSVAGPAVKKSLLLRTRTDYTSESGDPIARALATTMNFASLRDLPEVGDARVATAHQHHAGSAVSKPAADADRLSPGDVLFEVERGPLTSEHQARWANAVGPMDLVRPLVELAGEPLSCGETFESPAATRAAPNYDNGAMRFSYISSILTDWIADLGRLNRLRVLIQAPNLIGDVTRYMGTLTHFVVGSSQSDLGVRITGTNQFGIVTSTADAQISLVLLSPEQRSSSRPAEDPLDSFLGVAQRGPESIAVSSTAGSLSYGQLDRDSAAMANALQTRGVETGDIVGIYLPRSAELITALFAVLRAGAACLMLDPSYPPARLAQMARFCKVILCHGQTRPEAIPEVYIDIAGASFSSQSVPDSHSLPDVTGSSLAYIMFTSGSTQTPRATEITRAAMCASLRSMRDLGYESSDSCLHTASFSFSASVRQLFVPLSMGATVVLASAQEARDPELRLRLIQQHKVTVWDTTPSGLAQTVAYLTDKPSVLPQTRLRMVLLTGEPLHWSLIRQIRLRFPDACFINLYSQTETAGSVCAYRIPEGSGVTAALVPVGHTLPGNTVVVLNPESRTPVDPGEPGEIYVNSDRLAKGYKGAAQETASAFVNNLRALTGRWYRTGDRGFFDTAGQLVVTGRGDAVVNIRGVRVSLAEVEAAIASHHAIDEVLVLALEEASGTHSLAALVTVSNDAPKEAQLRNEIYSLLPAHMQPRRLVSLPSFPRLPNLKIDRQALLELCHTTPEQLDPSQELSELERQILGLVHSQTGSSISADEPVINAGLDSLAAVRLAAAIEDKFKRRLTLTSIYEAATVRQLACTLSTKDTEDSALVIVSGPRFANEIPLFCIPGVNGDPYYLRRAAALLKPNRIVYGLRYPDKPIATFEDLAASFIHHILRVQSASPYLIAGHSLGGRIAFEVARQLQQGGKVAIPIFVDASAPLLGARARTLGLGRRTLRHLSAVVRAIRKRPATPSVSSEDDPRVRAALKADSQYRPTPVRCSAILLKAEIVRSMSQRLLGKGSQYGWQRLALGGVKVVSIPGDHTSCLAGEAHVQVLAKRLDELLDSLAGGDHNAA
jgi:amino acid adenylation domain-containing protein